MSALIRQQPIERRAEIKTGHCLYRIGGPSLQPSDAPEPPEQRRAGNQDHADDGEITIFPLQFRHVLEVHAVDTGDRGRDCDDGQP